jgi:CheY-like chemotaxis protein
VAAEPTRHEILFVDDDRFFAIKYIENLEKQFDVHFLSEADQVIPFLEENLVVRAVVLDIMMPGPGSVAEDLVRGGLDTGLYLLERMQYLGTWPFPVLVITNRNPEEIRLEIGRRKITRRQVRVRQKLEAQASLLPQLLIDLMAGDLAERGALTSDAT